MSYFYNVFSEQLDDDFICQSEKKLEMKDVVVIEDCRDFTTAVVIKELDQYEVIINGYRPKDILHHIAIKPFMEKRKAEVRRTTLLQSLEERAKSVKAMDGFKKLAGNDPQMKKLLEEMETLEMAGKSGEGKDE